MRSSMRRLATLGSHLTSRLSSAVAKPDIVVNPGHHMADEKVHIRLHGLCPNQTVRLQAEVSQNGVTFQSHAVFNADSTGSVDVTRDESINGTYTGKDAMGLFWSLQSLSSEGRFVKKDVTSPAVYSIKLFEDKHDVESTDDIPIAETCVEMMYMKKGMKRIPVNEGPYRGTMFIPEGKGPFPGVIDVYGGLVSIIENRAALLATHGYATYALTYLYKEHLPDEIHAVDLRYITDAVNWFCEQPFVNKESIGCVGLCLGGTLTLYMASFLPQIRATVNINGTPISPKPPATVDDGQLPTVDKYGNMWPQPHRIFSTEEGFAVRDIWEGPDLFPIPAWRHGSKILAIIGEEDKQVHPKWHSYFRNNCPESFRQNIELVSYPGAGHLIEPPYSPLCKIYAPNPARVDGIYFIPPKYRDDPMLAGGIPEDHARAQEDAWSRILAFLDTNLPRV